ncbi:hypothetical protein SO802_017948 [Lithocarpus litseifolius]|uniref:Fe2OG dioxygenase domain-containing protein n=1 Tax=Lithocarpus litseifolius TaxID=425828 RepID=A0AAW2CJF0_9ROSI
MNLESYPPLFSELSKSSNQEEYLSSDHHQKVDTVDSIIIKPVVQDSDPIPVIDLQSLSLDELGEACEDWGLFRLVNHGVPPSLLNQLQDHAKTLYSLSFQSKQALFTTPTSYFWGTPALTPSGAPLSRGLQKINWVEGFNIPISQLSQLQPQHPVLASFRLLLEDYGKHLARLAKTIFEAMAMKLKLDEEQSKSNLSESTGNIRVYRYPSCSIPDTAWGIDVHTDSSVLSILYECEVGGLEVLRDDEWFQVKPICNALIVNLGDMMQAISNDNYKSVKHRVKLNKHKERISICYFVFPDEDSVIRSSKYKPFTYNDFRAQVQEDVKTHGFKLGLESFKLTEAL